MEGRKGSVDFCSNFSFLEKLFFAFFFFFAFFSFFFLAFSKFATLENSFFLIIFAFLHTKSGIQGMSGIGGVTSCVVHPLVLLSTVDHYNRVAADTRKRVVGVLLGDVHRGKVDCTNSFAVPFEEDLRNEDVWFLDHNYLENMFAMFKKVSAKERILGFYSTGPKIKSNDLKIINLLGRYCANPVLVVIDVRPGREELPTTAYTAVDKVEKNSGRLSKTFVHIPTSIGAVEAEEVGVEHLLRSVCGGNCCIMYVCMYICVRLLYVNHIFLTSLARFVSFHLISSHPVRPPRDINDPTVSTVANQIRSKIDALSTLKEKLLEMEAYLTAVLSGKLQPNQEIINNMQNIFSLLPNLNVPTLVNSMLIKTNDMHVIIYLSSLIRTVISLHDLVANRISFNEADDDKPEEKEEEKKDAEKDKAAPVPPAK